MASGYDHRDYARGYDGHSYGPRGYQMGPGWGWRDPDDPNWANGEYGGMRMRGDGRHVADYGRYRFFHQQDLGGFGGFDGRYDLPEGHFDRRGYYHEEGEAERQGLHPRYTPFPREAAGPQNGGVRYDREYLRQYNAHSPAFRHGGPGRSWGFSEGPGAPSMRGGDARGRPTDERGYAGYNRGGFADGKFRGPGTR